MRALLFGAECGLAEAEVDRILAGESRTWRVDEKAYRTVEGDLHEIVNCSAEGDIIMLDGRRHCSSPLVPFSLGD